MTPVEAICEEFGIKLIEANRYPELNETRAVSALERIYAKHGEEHLRLVMTTAAETANNKAVLEASLWWSISDLLVECRELFERDPERWLAVFDKAPIDQMIWALRGHKDKRRMLKGMMFERLRVAYADQKELFPMRAA